MKVNNPVYPQVDVSGLAKETTAAAAKTAAESANGKIGASGDAAADSPTTLFAGLKRLLSWFSGTWTAVRAAKIDKLDATISSRASNDIVRGTSGARMVYTSKKTTAATKNFTIPQGVNMLYIEACAAGNDGTTSAGGNGGECLRTTISVTPGDTLKIVFSNTGNITFSGAYTDSLGAGGGATGGCSSIFATGCGGFDLSSNLDKMDFVCCGGGGYGGGGNGSHYTSQKPGIGVGGQGGSAGFGGPGGRNSSYITSYSGGGGAYGAGGGMHYGSAASVSNSPGLGGDPIVVIFW